MRTAAACLCWRDFFDSHRTSVGRTAALFCRQLIAGRKRGRKTIFCKSPAWRCNPGLHFVGSCGLVENNETVILCSALI